MANESQRDRDTNSMTPALLTSESRTPIRNKAGAVASAVCFGPFAWVYTFETDKRKFLVSGGAALICIIAFAGSYIRYRLAPWFSYYDKEGMSPYFAWACSFGWLLPLIPMWLWTVVAYARRSPEFFDAYREQRPWHFPFVVKVATAIAFMPFVLALSWELYNVLVPSTAIAATVRADLDTQATSQQNLFIGHTRLLLINKIDFRSESLREHDFAIKSILFDGKPVFSYDNSHEDGMLKVDAIVAVDVPLHGDHFLSINVDDGYAVEFSKRIGDTAQERQAVAAAIERLNTQVITLVPHRQTAFFLVANSADRPVAVSIKTAPSTGGFVGVPGSTSAHSGQIPQVPIPSKTASGAELDKTRIFLIGQIKAAHDEIAILNHQIELDPGNFAAIGSKYDWEIHLENTKALYQRIVRAIENNESSK